MDVAKEHRRVVRALRAASAPRHEFDLQHYLGSPAPVLAVPSKAQKAIVRDFWRDHRDLTAAALNRLAPAFWRGRTFEERTFAIDLYVRYRKVRDDRSWRILDGWVDEAVGWGLCDHLAAHPVSQMAHERPSRVRELRRWTRSENLWRRRAVAYATYEFEKAGELDVVFDLLGRLLTDEEFWVQRAVGTWLRGCWGKDRRRTEAFLRKHVEGLPRVVITVATERAPKAFREELRAKR